ncbi:MAG: beta-lactamase family protein [Clostridia bacterium]|nr:beta-lactamase family protein [Clostridia bacterium]
MNYTFSDLQKYLDTVLVREKVPGFVCKVLHKGNLVFDYAGGYSDENKQKPMTGREHFFIYSASKPITCAAAMHAYEEGKFLMGHPLWWYLNEFGECKVKTKQPDGSITLEPLNEPIRVQDLFTMSAGLNYNFDTPAIKEALAKNPKAPTREIMRAIAKGNLDFQPGTRWQYSLCHDVLAGLVEVATGERFADYVKRVIFDPLGMNDTYLHPTPEIIENMAAQYKFNYSIGEPELVEKKNGYILGEEYDSGGAGIITTAGDYAKFIAAMANYGVGQNGARILSKAGVNLMRTNVFDGQRLKDFQGWMNNFEYGYGFGVRTKIGVGRGGNFSSIGEFGWDGAAGFLSSMDPEKNVAILYAQHVLNPQHEVIHNKIKNFVNMVIE